MGSEHKQVIILRKDLNMRKGKMVAQGAHARFTKICVSVNSDAELLAVHEKARAAGVLTSLILDAGLTEFGGVPTRTAVAVGPDHASKVDQITGELPLL